jgi:hypothetical protein
MATQHPPGIEHYNSAFNRAGLRALGYTLESALRVKAISISLFRSAQALANPKPVAHMKGAQRD